MNAALEAIVRPAVRGSADQTCQCAVVIEGRSSSFGAQVPDRPGCVAVVETEEVVLVASREAIDPGSAGSWFPGTM